MIRKKQNKILDAKIESNVNQYKVDRLNAEISAFSSGDLNKYEFLKRIDLNYKPNPLDKARLEFSPLGKTFNTGLDKTAQGYQEEGITKLLKDIRDSLAGNVIKPARPPRPDNNGNDNNGNDDNGNDDNNGNVIIPARPPRPDNNGNDDNGNDNNGNDDNGNVIIPARPPRPDNNGNDNNGNDHNGHDDNGIDNNGNDKTSFIDLSWMNDLQLYKKIAPEVFSRYNGDKNSFELFTLRTFIDNINNEHVKNKKDAREEFKNVKKNVKSEALKEIVNDLEQAIFGDDDNDESLIEGLDKDILEEEKLDRRFKNLISKKLRESLREYLKESKDANSQDKVNALKEYLKELKDANSQDKVNALKEYLKESKDANLQDRANALKKKLNNSFKKISEDNNNNNDNDDSKDNDNDDSEDNQTSNFVDEVLKKVSKEIINDDAKKVSKEIVNDDAKKNITERTKKKEVSKNLFDKQIKEILELDKKYMESRAKTDKTIKELSAEPKDREEVSKKTNEAIKKYYTNEAQKASKEIEKYNKIINDNLDMSSEKS